MIFFLFVISNWLHRLRKNFFFNFRTCREENNNSNLSEAKRRTFPSCSFKLITNKVWHKMHVLPKADWTLRQYIRIALFLYVLQTCFKFRRSTKNTFVDLLRSNLFLMCFPAYKLHLRINFVLSFVKHKVPQKRKKSMKCWTIWSNKQKMYNSYIFAHNRVSQKWWIFFIHVHLFTNEYYISIDVHCTHTHTHTHSQVFTSTKNSIFVKTLHSRHACIY